VTIELEHEVGGASAGVRCSGEQHARRALDLRMLVAQICEHFMAEELRARTPRVAHRRESDVRLGNRRPPRRTRN
jgi:hypothetical protein